MVEDSNKVDGENWNIDVDECDCWRALQKWEQLKLAVRVETGSCTVIMKGGGRIAAACFRGMLEIKVLYSSSI